MDDKKIIELYNSRSEKALFETEKKYGKLVSFLICKLIKNKQDIEECVNDTYLGVWTTIPPKKPDNLKAYVLKIARNQALKKYEYLHAAKRDIDLCTSYDELSNYLEMVELNDCDERLKDVINEFMSSLPKNQRQVFLLRYWYFMSIKEICESCNLSKSKVEMILFRTRNKLKVYLSERGYL